MKLELKHLAPYLPYGLKLQILEHPFGIIPRTFELDCGHDFNYHLQQGNVNPILVPLKELQYYSNGIKHLGYRTDQNNYLNLISDIICKRANYDLMEMCFKEHIDVFCLIESGLAIDINTLSTQNSD